MISINISELIWTVINFFLLMFLLNRFLYKPVISFMEKRQARIDAGLQEEQDAKTCIEKNDERLQEKKAEKLMGYVPMRQYSLFEDNSKGKTD